MLDVKATRFLPLIAANLTETETFCIVLRLNIAIVNVVSQLNVLKLDLHLSFVSGTEVPSFDDCIRVRSITGFAHGRRGRGIRRRRGGFHLYLLVDLIRHCRNWIVGVFVGVFVDFSANR